jgi:hypothetical protein
MCRRRVFGSCRSLYGEDAVCGVELLAGELKQLRAVA